MNAICSLLGVVLYGAAFGAFVYWRIKKQQRRGR